MINSFKLIPDILPTEHACLDKHIGGGLKKGSIALFLYVNYDLKLLENNILKKYVENRYEYVIGNIMTIKQSIDIAELKSMENNITPVDNGFIICNKFYDSWDDLNEDINKFPKFIQSAQYTFLIGKNAFERFVHIIYNGKVIKEKINLI